MTRLVETVFNNLIDILDKESTDYPIQSSFKLGKLQFIISDYLLKGKLTEEEHDRLTKKIASILHSTEQMFDNLFKEDIN